MGAPGLAFETWEGSTWDGAEFTRKNQRAYRFSPGGTAIFSPYNDALIDPDAPRGPCGCPSVRGISPVSAKALKCRRFSMTACLGFRLKMVCAAVVTLP